MNFSLIRFKVIEKAQSFSSVNYLIFFFILSALMYAPALFSWWGPVDDHEIIQFLGNDQVLHVNEIWSEISRTEILQFGKSSRFRPSYYFIRILETVVWGDQVWLWYLFRIMSFGYFASIFFWLLSKFISKFESFLFSIFLMSFQFWIDIISRLGPAEFYGFLGMAIFCHGYILIRKNINSTIPIYVMIVGLASATGTKENFIFFPLFIFGILYLTDKSQAYCRKRLFYILLISIFTSSIIFFGFIPSIIGSGKDIYQNSVSISPINIFSSLLKCKPLLMALCAIGILKIKSYIPKNYFIAILIILILFFSQVIFYRNAGPFGMRYDFPGLLFIYLIFVLLYVGSVDKLKSNKAYLITYCVLFSLSFFKYIKPFKAFDISYRGFQKTNEFKRLISKLQNTNIKDILLEYGDPTIQYEIVYSIPIFLKNMNISKNITITEGTTSKPSNDTKLEEELLRELKTIESSGSDYISPKKILVREECFSVLLGSETSFCKNFIKFNW